MTEPATIVPAAGAVALRTDAAGNTEVLVVHRPRYDDWSLPKGKCDEHELAPAAAVREVAEETGHRVRLGAPLAPVHYALTGRQHPPGTQKSVSWWRSDLTCDDAAGRVGDGAAALDTEVDRVAWIDAGQATRLLSYRLDHTVLRQALQQPVTTPVALVRHAKAVNRKDWVDEDAVRPLRPRGRKQARGLTALFDAYGVVELFTSPWHRCSATLQPYALQADLKQHLVEVFNEDAGAEDPDGVQRTMTEIAEQAVVHHRPTAICGHRPVIGDMLTALDIPARALATAECVVAHLTDSGELHAVEWHRPHA